MTAVANVLSPMRLADWQGAITWFEGFYETIPWAISSPLRWSELVDAVAPGGGPTLVADKAKAPYILPCLLHAAPFTGKTKAKAARRGLGPVGKQRSANHVTSSSWLLFDLDGITSGEFKAARGAIKAAGVSYAFWTSYSFGDPNKPGLRGRLAIPHDGDLTGLDYSRAWHGACAAFGIKADKSGSRLHQQQGAWATHPSRAVVARRKTFDGGVASASALMALAPLAAPASTRSTPPAGAPGGAASAVISTGQPINLAQVKAALAVLDPNDYAEWDRALSLLVAMSQAGNGAELRQIAEDFSNRADDVCRSRNDLPQYSPSARFENWTPSIPADVAAASLYAMARDKALPIVRKAKATNCWAGTRATWEYLAAYHRRQFDQVTYTSELVGGNV